MCRKIVHVCLTFLFTTPLLVNGHAGERPLSDPQSCEDELQSPSKPYSSSTNQGIHALLRQAFFPLVEEFKTSVLSQDNQTLGERLRYTERQFPAGLSNYVNHAAFLNPADDPKKGFLFKLARFFSPALEYSQRLVNYNAWNGREFYGMDRNPEFASYQSHLWIHLDEKWASRYGTMFYSLGSLITPVGKYGERVARVQVKTTLLLMEMAERTLADSSRHFFHSHPQVHRHVGRIRQGHSEKAQLELTPLGNFMEGLISFNQFVSLALAEGIPGQEDPSAAVEELLAKNSSRIGLVSEFTARLPVTALGPMTLAGFYMRDMWVRDSANQLRLSPQITLLLQNMRDARIQEQTERTPPVTCPMASLHRKASESSCGVTGLQLIAQAYWHVFQFVWQNEPL